MLDQFELNRGVVGGCGEIIGWGISTLTLIENKSDYILYMGQSNSNAKFAHKNQQLLDKMTYILT